MSRSLILFFLFCTPFMVATQTIDSSAIRQVDSLIKVSVGLGKQRDYEKALEINTLAEKLTLEKLGRETAAYGSCCHNRGRMYYFKRDYPEAEKWYLDAIAIRKKVLGNEHPDYASSLYNLAGLYKDIVNYDKSESMYLEAKAIREKALGKEHPDYVWTLNNLAILYMSMGHFEKAESLALETKATWEITMGKNNSNYASSLNNLANLYQRMGDYEKAEPLALEAEVISKKRLGEDHPDYATTLSNLGVLYNKYMGNYEKAERYYLGASAIWKKTLDKEHPYNAGILNNLGELYLSMGNYEKSEQFLLEANAIKKTTLGEEHPEYAVGLYNLAILYTEMGKYEKAEPLYLEAMRIQENVSGKYNPSYAENINGLANNYSNLGNYDKAKNLYLEAVDIHEKLFGKDNFNYATLNLAALYTDMKLYKEAELLFLETKLDLERVIGKDHPLYAICLFYMAVLYKEMGNYEKAEMLFMELANRNQFLLSRALHYMSEGELSNYLHTFSERQIQMLSLAQITSNKESNISPTCYDNSLFYKGFLLNSANQIKRLALSDSVATEKFKLLKSYKRRLAAEYAKPIAERDSARVADLDEKANALEKDLARTVAGYGDVIRQVYWQEVQQKLKVDEVAIEFVHYRYVDKRLKDSLSSTSPNSIMYAALLLKPGDTQPQFIPFFEEKQLQNVLVINKERPASENLLDIYTVRGVTPINEYSLHGLNDLIWKPLDKYLKGVNTVYYSPSGLLHRINFDAIPIDNKQILSDKHNLVRLTSMRSLVIPDLTKINSSNEAILYGGIEYEIDTTHMSLDSTIEIKQSITNEELSFANADRSISQRGDNWNFLPGTENEIAGIAKIFHKVKYTCKQFKRENATEESFKTIGFNNPSPRILHIATHGYFFPDPKEEVGSSNLAFRNIDPIFKMSDHPMIRSGLILAGGNHAWKTGKPYKEGSEDGILTAYEISQMNLSNTELVVLSACETALGDIQGNEGVYGLQRAFKIAGAKYLIMSLWQVPDKQTSLLMITFYKKWLEKKMTIPNAFHAAQKELRDLGLDPYQWAGFVLVE